VETDAPEDTEEFNLGPRRSHARNTVCLEIEWPDAPGLLESSCSRCDAEKQYVDQVWRESQERPKQFEQPLPCDPRCLRQVEPLSEVRSSRGSAQRVATVLRSGCERRAP